MRSKWIIRYLREIWHKHKQEFEFVQEFQSYFGFDNLVTVDPVGRSGGLAVYYNNEYQVNVLYSSIRMIDVEAVALGKMVYMTFVCMEIQVKTYENKCGNA